MKTVAWFLIASGLGALASAALLALSVLFLMSQLPGRVDVVDDSLPWGLALSIYSVGAVVAGMVLRSLCSPEG